MLTRDSSVLPPPPVQYSQPLYSQTPLYAPPVAPVETNNILSHPNAQFSAGEGTYVLQDELLLATPPPHPNEVQVPVPNPLATTPQPARAGTRVSLVNLSTRSRPPILFRGASKDTIEPRSQHSSIEEHPHEGRLSVEKLSLGGSDAENKSATSHPSSSVFSFGEGNTVLSTAFRDASKRRKPKSSMAKSSSSFIARCTVNDHVSKRIAERPDDGYFAFANVNRAFQWLDLSTNSKADPLTKTLFAKAHCICHDANQATKSSTHVDLVMGFSTGEIIWYEPFNQKYSRLNKNGMVNPTAVSDIKWLPSSENLFLAAHEDGSLIVYDKEKDDAAFVPSEHEQATLESSHVKSSDGAKIHVWKTVASKNQKFNPISYWKLSNQRITALSFSPDHKHLAVVSDDGTLRVIDYLSEKLLGLFSSYYGGFSCVCWSPDSRYIVTGGQDDLVSIWSFETSKLVARCPGHQSFVNSVAFDPWQCDEKSYRFGTVGADCRLLLWDFSVGMLHRPKAPSVRHRGSLSSRHVSPLQRADTHNTTLSRLRSNSTSSHVHVDEHTIEHPVQPKAVTPTLTPIMSAVIDTHPLTWLSFTESSIITSCKSGHIRTWERPPKAAILAPSGDLGNFI